MSVVLTVQHLQHQYAGVQALRGVSFELQQAECVALIGPNGAGKSTCFACLAGQQIASAGQIVWRDQNLMQVPVTDRRALGIGRTFQVAQVFEALTVMQNLQLVLKAKKGVSALDVLDDCDHDAALACANATGLEALGMEVLHSSAAQLSYGNKKRLELAMAMAGLPDPGRGLLLLDEPAAGLSPEERLDMMARIRILTQQGTTVLYTEHNMDAVFGVADRVLVLMEGQLLAQGLPEDMAAHPEVRARYLGTHFAPNERRGHA
ncbi:MAG: Lipopolysaccharide export system ATP-binding protein LptB [Pseudomonadota bacterium]|jgi:branched-chain amino acid transport system ATP-binding protein